MDWHTGEAVHSLIKERNMTAEQFGEEMGRSRAWVYTQLRANKWRPETLGQAARLLGVTTEYLATGKGSRGRLRAESDRLPPDLLRAFAQYRTDVEVAGETLRRSVRSRLHRIAVALEEEVGQDTAYAIVYGKAHAPFQAAEQHMPQPYRK